MASTSTALPTALPSGASLSNEACHVLELILSAPTEPLYRKGGIRFKGVLEAVSAIFAGLCCILVAFLVLLHLSNFTASQEQRQLVRVILMLPVFALCSLFSVVYYQASGYLYPISELAEPFAIVALFYFYVSVVTPDSTVREEFYNNFERRARSSGSSGTKKHGSLRWFHLHWILVFQLLLGRFGSFIAYEITVATNCALSKEFRHRTNIIRIVETVQIVVAVIAVINYQRTMRRYLSDHRALAKLLTFKILIIVITLQTLIFGALTSARIWHPTRKIGYFDLAVGVPNLVICIETFIASLIFLWSYSPRLYQKLAKEHPGEVRSFALAAWDVINISDVLLGLLFTFRALIPGNFGKRRVQTRPDGHVGMVRESSEDPLPVK